MLKIDSDDGQRQSGRGGGTTSGRSLLDTLRDRLGLTSVKRGCEVGECGACTVLVDGEAIDSCIYLTVWAEGKHGSSR